MTMKLPTPRTQQGSMLLEGLIAIVIFSMGILALMGLQAASIANTSEAKFRADAAFLANKVIARMWVADPASRVVDFSSAGKDYLIWKTEVGNQYTGLPGGIAPTVTFSAPRPGTTNVLVTVLWRSPNQAASSPQHSYTVQTEFNP